MPAVGAGVTVEVVVGKGVGEEVGVGPPQAIVTTIRVARISVFTLSTVYLKNAHIYHRAAGGLTNRSCWRLFWHRRTADSAVGAGGGVGEPRHGLEGSGKSG